MSSISCSNASFSANGLDKEEAPDISDVLVSSNSVAYMVGTHKDKVTKERITEINEQLKKIIGHHSVHLRNRRCYHGQHGRWGRGGR